MTKPLSLPEAQTTSGSNELLQANQRIATLESQLEAANKKTEASEKLVSEMLIRCRSMKMQNESLSVKAQNFDKIAPRYESSKSLIGRLRENVLNLQKEAKLRIAAESLLGALLHKIDESKRGAYIDRVLAKESIEVRNKLRPVLARCESRKEVNESLKAFKGALHEARSSRGLPPVTENGRRASRILPESPLLTESQGDKTNTETVDPRIQESVNFTRKVMKHMRS
jgi:Zn-dependent M32 family carboxypeptidase